MAAVTLSGEKDRPLLPTSMRTVAAEVVDRRVRRVVVLVVFILGCLSLFALVLVWMEGR